MRDVRYDSEAAKAIDEASEVWDRADIAVGMIEWAIARDPTVGQPLTESGVSRVLTICGAISIGMPTVTYAYEIEQHYITVRTASFEVATQNNKSKAH